MTSTILLCQYYVNPVFITSESDPVPFEDQDPPGQFQSSSSGFTLLQVICQLVSSIFTIIRDNFEKEWLVSLPGAEIVQAGGA